MYYNYSLLVQENTKKKRKLIILIVLLIIVIILSILLGIKYSIDYKAKQYVKSIENDVNELEEQIANSKKEEEEREKKRLKNSQPLNEQQIQAIEKIYTSQEKRVFLTFDDGPTKSVTPYILDLLKQENIKATFFVLGNRVKSNPDLIKREFDEGHYIANHRIFS